MAIGIHWEWRGFGAVSSEFAHRFGELESLFPPQDVEDVYLWVSGLEVNVKVRDIPEEPFKFKRLQDKDGDLEQWAENPEDIFKFPLDEAGWDAVAKVFAEFDVALGPFPPEKVNCSLILDRVRNAGADQVDVRKRRESKLWPVSDGEVKASGQVKVEWACISSPQASISIGLETWDEAPVGQGLSDEQAIEDISAAIEALGLDKEPLKPMNYLDAVAVWASGGRV